jgi:RND family efflux transporter MFP subunit
MNIQLPLATFAILAVALLSSCGSSEPKITEAEAVRVDVQPILPQSIAAGRTYSGTLEAGEGTSISFSVPGTIKRIYVQKGDRVSRGQLIAELDAETLRNTYESSLATLEQAKDAYARLKKLHDANSLSDMQWVEMETKLKQAQSAADVSRRALDDAKIYAPFAGVVADKYADVSQTVAPAMPVVRVVTLSGLTAKISVPENEIAAMRQGLKASVDVEALQGSAPHPAVLTEKAVTANPLSRSYDVKFRISAPTQDMLPGMICSVSVDGTAGEATEEAIVLPAQSVLLSADNQRFVWLAKNGRAEKRIVEIGEMTADGIVVNSGLASGDSVIVKGMQKVSTGTQVVPVNK